MRTALVLGGASCVWRDADDARVLFNPDLIVAINDMIALWPHRIDIAVTLHPEKLAAPGKKKDFADGDWLRRRFENGFEKPALIVAHSEKYSANQKFPVDQVSTDWSGSSSLFAVKVLRERGVERTILAGCPMDTKAGHFVRQQDWQSATTFRNAWIVRKKEIAPHVRSMSGWTREMFGAPTPEWLAEGSNQ